jgi:hypothetical protein
MNPKERHMTDLLARLEVAEAGSRELNLALGQALGLIDASEVYTLWDGSRTAAGNCDPWPDWTASLDAALALAKRVYPEGWLDLYIHGGKASAAQCFEGNRAYTATHASSPIAVCIAILKATHKAEGAEG